MTKRLMATTLCAVLLCTGCTNKVEPSKDVEVLESEVTTLTTKVTEPTAETVEPTAEVIETDEPALENADPAELWQAVRGVMFSMNGGGSFTAKKPNGVIVQVAVDSDVVSPAKVSDAIEFGVYFIPVYEESGGEIAVSSMQLYTADGKPLTGEDCNSIIDRIITEGNASIEAKIANAKPIGSSTKISELDRDVLYSGEEVSLTNDTGANIVCNVLKYDTFSERWESEEEYIFSKSFPNNEVTFKSSNDEETAYYTFSLLEDITAITLDSDCILVSNLTTEPFDTFSAECIYNDTDADAIVFYTRSFGEEESCAVKAGELMEFDWMYYDDLHI